MKEKKLKEPFSKTEYLAGYQILGGLAGLIFLAIPFFQSSIAISPIFLLILIPFSFYSYSIVCGILIFRSEKIGLKHSLVNQFLQLIGFSAFGYTVNFASGITTRLHFDFTSGFNLHIDFGISSWQLLIYDDIGIRSINIDIIALGLIIFIIRQLKMLKNENLQDQLTIFGEE